jgi:hypothetical protein
MAGHDELSLRGLFHWLLFESDSPRTLRTSKTGHQSAMTFLRIVIPPGISPFDPERSSLADFVL